MHRLNVLLFSVLVALVSSVVVTAQGRQPTGAVLFEGARLISSAGPPVEN